MPKSGTHFHFKRFSVRHDACTMKVGTDGVLLGAWVDVNSRTRILDIGTGSGVIALMLAQRTNENVLADAVEIEASDAEQALENSKASPWAHRIKIHHTSIQGFDPGIMYDCIVSNPPYFNNSQKSTTDRRTEVRHTTSLDYKALLGCVQKLLSSSGRFSVVLPFTEGLQFIELAREYSLYPSRKFSFRTRKEKPIERWLLEFSCIESTISEGEVLLYEKDLEWSPVYLSLTRDFYLNI